MSEHPENACINAYVVDMWVRMICAMGETPHLIVKVDRTLRELVVPLDRVVDGEITLSVLPASIINYNMDFGRGVLTFGARFNGKPMNIKLPCEAVIATVAKESNVGALMPLSLAFYKEPSYSRLEDDSNAPLRGLPGPEGIHGPEGISISGEQGTPSGPEGKKGSHLTLVK